MPTSAIGPGRGRCSRTGRRAHQLGVGDWGGAVSCDQPEPCGSDWPSCFRPRLATAPPVAVVWRHFSPSAKSGKRPPPV